MQFDLFGSGHDLDLRSNFPNDILRLNYSSFDATRQEKYDAGKMNVVPLLSKKKYFRKMFFFCKKRLFLELEAKLDLQSNLRVPLRNSVKRVIECTFPRRCISSGTRVMRQFVEKC